MRVGCCARQSSGGLSALGLITHKQIETKQNKPQTQTRQHEQPTQTRTRRACAASAQAKRVSHEQQTANTQTQTRTTNPLERRIQTQPQTNTARQTQLPLVQPKTSHNRRPPNRSRSLGSHTTRHQFTRQSRASMQTMQLITRRTIRQPKKITNLRARAQRKHQPQKKLCRPTHFYAEHR
jgi:glutamate/tyrosine decarboxylase-like PLP-dependent enzyme